MRADSLPIRLTHDQVSVLLLMDFVAMQSVANLTSERTYLVASVAAFARAQLSAWGPFSLCVAFLFARGPSMATTAGALSVFPCTPVELCVNRIRRDDSVTGIATGNPRLQALGGTVAARSVANSMVLWLFED